MLLRKEKLAGYMRTQDVTSLWSLFGLLEDGQAANPKIEKTVICADIPAFQPPGAPQGLHA